MSKVCKESCARSHLGGWGWKKFWGADWWCSDEQGESVNAPGWNSESLWRSVRFSSLSVPDDYLKQLDVCPRRLPQARTGSSTLLPPNNGSRGGCIVETGYP